MNMQTSPNDVSNQEILEAIHAFSSDMDGRMNSMDQCVDKMDKRLGRVEQEIITIKATMVTKDYLDEKIADLRGDLVLLVRKEDRKLAAVVDELVRRNVFDQDTALRIFSLEPFARA